MPNLLRPAALLPLVVFASSMLWTQQQGASSSKTGSYTISEAPQSKITFDSSETLFSIFAALNACGYDVDLASAQPLRQQVRTALARAASSSASDSASGPNDARAAQIRLCAFYREHTQPDSAHTLAQYVSLGLYTGDAPKFLLTLQRRTFRRMPLTSKASFPFCARIMPPLACMRSGNNISRTTKKCSPVFISRSRR